MKKWWIGLLGGVVLSLSGMVTVQADEVDKEEKQTVCDIPMVDIHVEDGGALHRSIGDDMRVLDGTVMDKGEIEWQLAKIHKVLLNEGVDVRNFKDSGVTVYRTHEDIAGLNGIYFDPVRTKTDVDVPSIFLMGDPVVSFSFGERKRKTAAHEFMHFIDYTYFRTSDFHEYREIREMKEEWRNLASTEWRFRPAELFAEDLLDVMFDEHRLKTGVPNLDEDEKEKFLALVVKVLKRDLGEVDGQEVMENHSCVKVVDEEVEEEKEMSKEEKRERFENKQAYWNDMDEGEQMIQLQDRLAYHVSDYKKAQGFFRSEVAYSLGLLIEEEGSDFAFYDIPANHVWRTEAEKAYEAGWMLGKGDHHFGWEDELTREQAMTLLARAFEVEDQGVEKAFLDEGYISGSLEEDVQTMIQAGYVQGFNGYLNPQESVTRSEWWRLLVRVYQDHWLDIDENWYE